MALGAPFFCAAAAAVGLACCADEDLELAMLDCEACFNDAMFDCLGLSL